jgi:peptidoglycan/LPS O-acetylase OafA/YrhL
LLYLSGIVEQAYLYNAFDARFDNLAIGCLLATVVGSSRMAGFAKRLGARPWAPLVTLGLMTAILRTGTLTRHLVGFTLYAALAAILIVQLLQLHESAMWRWLDYSPVRFVGEISYPIYLYHGWGLGLGLWLTMLPPFGQFLSGVIFTFVGALGSYFVIERPFLALKRRFAPGRAPVRAIVPGAHRQPSVT